MRALGNITVNGTPVATLADVGNYVSGLFISGENALGLSAPPDTVNAEIYASTAKAMGPGASAAEIAAAAALAQQQYWAAYNQSLALQGAGDVPITDAIAGSPTALAWIAAGVAAVLIGGYVLGKV